MLPTRLDQPIADDLSGAIDRALFDGKDKIEIEFSATTYGALLAIPALEQARRGMLPKDGVIVLSAPGRSSDEP